MNFWLIFIFYISFISCVGANCETGYTLAGTYCYKFDASRKGDFETQKRRCESEGSHLIEYPDYQSFEDLSALVRSYYGKSSPVFWIGLKASYGSDLSDANSYHWLSDNFEKNTKLTPILLPWRNNYRRYLRQKHLLCVWTWKVKLRNNLCTRTKAILACQYDPLIGLMKQQDMRARDDRYYQSPPLRSSYAGRTSVGNLASDRQARLKVLRDQKNSGQLGYGTSSYGNSANSNNGMGYGVDRNNQYGSSQNQNAGNQFGNGGIGKYGNGGYDIMKKDGGTGGNTAAESGASSITSVTGNGGGGEVDAECNESDNK